MLRQFLFVSLVTGLGVITVVRPASAILMDAPRGPALRSIAVNPQPLPPRTHVQASHQLWRHPPNPCRACTKAW
jgi:hypothetical protein